ncbi:hypothetical protein D9M69_690870 [compost metagenome]
MPGDLDQRLRQIARQRFTAAQNLSSSQRRQTRMAGEHAPCRGSRLDGADLLRFDLRPQAFRITRGIAVHQHHAGPRDQRQIQLQRGDIEGQ